MISDRARAWLQTALGRAITEIEQLSGGLTDTISAVRLADGERVILRYLQHPMRFTTPERQASSEALACRLMAETPVPAPRLLAVDPTGELAGAPATVTSWVPGGVRLDHLSAAALTQVAEIAVQIHVTALDPADQPLPYASWVPEKLEIPFWTTDPGPWREAIELYAGPRPMTTPTLLHRDFHPGNLLWRADTLSGVIDWADTSWGPADLDVAHCYANFFVLHDAASADTFLEAYRRFGGELDPDPQAWAYWRVADLFTFLPDPDPVLRAILDRRPDLEIATIRDRFELLLRQVLS